MKVKSIKSKGIHKTWDLEVKYFHNYFLENGIVSHNSANLSNSTSGIDVPRELVQVKTDKSSTIKKPVPFYKTSKNYYTTAWGDDFNNIDYFKLLGSIAPFIDQSISTNQYSNALKEPDKKLKLPKVLEEILTANKVGLKTIYYQNFLSVDNEDGLSEKSKGCGSGGCSV